MSISKTIADNYFDTDLTNAFLDLTISLSTEQPLKIPFIAAIVLQTNTQKPEFTEEVLKKVGDALQKHIDQGLWREVKLMLRFLACLQGLFMGDGIFPILEDLFTRAGELQANSNDDVSLLHFGPYQLLTCDSLWASNLSRSFCSLLPIRWPPQPPIVKHKQRVFWNRPRSLLLNRRIS